VLVQTNEWHPVLLDEALNSEVNILLLDRFSEDGTFVRRYALELPLPRMEIHLSDADSGFIYGYAVPSAGDGPTTAFSFTLPEKTSAFPVRKRAILRKVKEINGWRAGICRTRDPNYGLRGDVHIYVAQEIRQIAHQLPLDSRSIALF